jgi:Baseplate J-like protein
MSTNVPQIQWTEQGLVVPSEAEILLGVIADYNAAFGGNLNFTNLFTPQGQLATSQAACIANNYALFAMLVNGVDPDLNSGFMQDVIGRIYFLNRVQGTPTVVECTCVGIGGTIIATGALAQDTAGNIYNCVEGGTIPVGGSITLEFQNNVDGPIPCPASTLTTIYQAVPGWESITNPAQGIEGSNVQSAESFEFTREQSVAANAHGSADSIYGAVITLPGVTDAYVFENTTGSPIDVGSTDFTLVAHSVFVGVIGGDPQSIANAIWTKKDLGCDMNGNTTETVVDTNYAFPQPSYTITFNNNATNPVVFDFTVNIKNSSALPGTIVADVQAAVAAQFNGTLPGSQRVRIGSLLLTSSFVGAVANCEGPSIPVQVLSIFLGDAFSGHGTLVLGSKVLTVTGVTSGTLTPGSVVSDAASAIPANTQIVQQLTGTPGGDGTYYMTAAATSNESSPEVITATATGIDALIGIDQAPELGSVTVNLV